MNRSELRRICSALIAGIVFGVGLLISGMANPAKVLAFLDISGDWDPSLALVMLGAIAVGLIGFRFAKIRGRSQFGGEIDWPAAKRPDLALVAGSLLFGAGWGLAGFCPGPGLVAVGAGVPEGLVFVVAMIAGMVIFNQLPRKT